MDDVTRWNGEVWGGVPDDQATGDGSAEPEGMLPNKITCKILVTMPDRLETPILTVAKRRKALTVFTLTPMMSATSLLVSP